MTEPEIKLVRAIEVVPFFFGVWCSTGGDPFVNTIEMRKWSDDGRRIWFMLGTHNFVSAEPDEEIRVVEMRPNVSEEIKWLWARHDVESMAHRPNACAKCGQPLGEG